MRHKIIPQRIIFDSECLIILVFIIHYYIKKIHIKGGIKGKGFEKLPIFGPNNLYIVRMVLMNKQILVSKDKAFRGT